MGQHKIKNKRPKKKVKKANPRLLFLFLVIFAVWIGLSVSDYRLVCHEFEKPKYAYPVKTQDDGGSGTYVGLGYSFEIEGNFMPEDEKPGVTEAKFYLMGIKLKEAVRE